MFILNWFAFPGLHGSRCSFLGPHSGRSLPLSPPPLLPEFPQCNTLVHLMASQQAIGFFLFFFQKAQSSSSLLIFFKFLSLLLKLSVEPSLQPFFSCRITWLLLKICPWRTPGCDHLLLSRFHPVALQ